MSEAEPDPSGNSNSSFYLGKIFQIYCFFRVFMFFSKCSIYQDLFIMRYQEIYKIFLSGHSRFKLCAKSRTSQYCLEGSLFLLNL